MIPQRKQEIKIEGFPPLVVIRPEKGSGEVSVEGLVESYYTKQTNFNHAVVPFGDFFEGMKGIVPQKKRWGTETSIPENVLIFPADENMDSLTRLANTKGVYENLDLKREYRESLRKILENLYKKANLNPRAKIIAIKRAGVVAAQFLHPESHFLTFEAKRLPFVDGTLGVGMEDKDRVLTPKNLKGDIEIDEVFLASGATILAFMIDCYSRKIRPESLTIVAPFIAQQGTEAVLKLSARLGWQIRILGSRIYYWLNDHWYVLAAPNIQAGGDAGDLTEI